MQCLRRIELRQGKINHLAVKSLIYSRKTILFRQSFQAILDFPRLCSTHLKEEEDIKAMEKIFQDFIYSIHLNILLSDRRVFMQSRRIANHKHYQSGKDQSYTEKSRHAEFFTQNNYSQGCGGHGLGQRQGHCR